MAEKSASFEQYLGSELFTSMSLQTPDKNTKNIENKDYALKNNIKHNNQHTHIIKHMCPRIPLLPLFSTGINGGSTVDQRTSEMRPNRTRFLMLLGPTMMVLNLPVGWRSLVAKNVLDKWDKYMVG